MKNKVNTKIRVALDQEIEIEYNKPAKGPSGIIGYIKKKQEKKWKCAKIEHRAPQETKIQQPCVIYLASTMTGSIPSSST